MRGKNPKVFCGFAVNFKPLYAARLRRSMRRRNGGYSLFYSCPAKSVLLNAGKTFAHYRRAGLFWFLFMIDAAFASQVR
ncbi:hypothetical protein [Burkholderia sp. MSMB2157WGS]|uniref:hypothetical protein n=1 Tax=Burkholderia sp. MSMB2157WGS TaxID=1637928 RepID=UPI0012E3B346|nr:hypothetical protein [Burkholderia sp. MSMB2157WGS]